MDKKAEDTRVYMILRRFVKMRSRESRREFLLLLFAISLFFVALGAEFGSPTMPIISDICFILGAVFFGLFLWFYFWSRKTDISNSQEDTLKKMLGDLERIESKLDRVIERQHR